MLYCYQLLSMIVASIISWISDGSRSSRKLRIKSNCEVDCRMRSSDGGSSQLIRYFIFNMIFRGEIDFHAGYIRNISKYIRTPKVYGTHALKYFLRKYVYFVHAIYGHPFELYPLPYVHIHHLWRSTIDEHARFTRESASLLERCLTSDLSREVFCRVAPFALWLISHLYVQCVSWEMKIFVDSTIPRTLHPRISMFAAWRAEGYHGEDGYTNKKRDVDPGKDVRKRRTRALACTRQPCARMA